MNLYIRPPPFGATKQAIRNIIINQKKKEMNKRFAIAILPKEKQQGGEIRLEDRKALCAG